MKKLFIISVCLLLSGCLKRDLPLPWTSKLMGLESPIGLEEIYRIPGGEKISFDHLMEEIDPAKVIFVGEVHDQFEHHQIQLRVLRALRERGKEVVLAMEMFEKSRQPILDRWTRGDFTHKEFRKETDWENTWGIDYDLYRPILDEAKNEHLKILALNVDRDLVSKVARDGIKGLSPEDRKKLPETDLSDKQHRSYIRLIYRHHHGGQAKGFERFYESQCLWDEGMAEPLSGFLSSPDSKGKTVLVLAGDGHIVFDFGIPKRFYRRTPEPFKTVVLKVWSREPDQDLLWHTTSSPLADFLWVTRASPEERKRPRVGLFLKEKEGAQGLWIERVIPESPAEKAGLLAGDQLIAVEGKEISEVAEIHDILSQKGWGANLIMTVIRDGTRKEITVTLPALKQE